MITSLYIRVSTEDQAREGYSLDVQKEYLTSFANQQGYAIHEIYADEGVSAGSINRPALQKLLQDARGKKFNLVMVYKIDRFSRRLKDLLDLVEKLESYGVGFKSATEPFDTTTSAGKLMFQQLGSFAEFERNRHAERVFPGMVKSIQSGNWHGSRYSPFGYSYNKQNKLLEVVEIEANVVKLIFKMCLEGKSIQQIADYLNHSKHETRIARFFYTKLIRDILRNPIYTGKIVWNRNHYDKKQKTKRGYKYLKNDPSQYIVGQGKHPPLVSDADFQKAQALLTQRRTYNHQRKHGHYPLTGLLYCDKCNHRYFGVSNISNHKTGQRDCWYRCSGRQQFNIKCNGAAIKAADAENIILSAMQNMLESDRLKDSRWLYMTKDENASAPGFFDVGSANTKKALETNREKQLKLADLYLDGSLSKETFSQKNAELRREEDELRASIAGMELLSMERENSQGYLERVREFLSGYDAQKQELTSADKKDLLALVFKKIAVANSTKKADFSARISPALYEPFQKIFAEEKSAKISRKDNEKCADIILKPSDAK